MTGSGQFSPFKFKVIFVIAWLYGRRSRQRPTEAALYCTAKYLLRSNIH
jgi:hypothetical protein